MGGCGFSPTEKVVSRQKPTGGGTYAGSSCFGKGALREVGGTRRLRSHLRVEGPGCFVGGRKRVSRKSLRDIGYHTGNIRGRDFPQNEIEPPFDSSEAWKRSGGWMILSQSLRMRRQGGSFGRKKEDSFNAGAETPGRFSQRKRRQSG